MIGTTPPTTWTRPAAEGLDLGGDRDGAHDALRRRAVVIASPARGDRAHARAGDRQHQVPETLQVLPDPVVNVTGLPEPSPVAVSVSGPSPYVASSSVGKAMDWGALSARCRS